MGKIIQIYHIFTNTANRIFWPKHQIVIDLPHNSGSNDIWRKSELIVHRESFKMQRNRVNELMQQCKEKHPNEVHVIAN